MSEIGPGRSGRAQRPWKRAATGYVVTVAFLAAAGFIADSTLLIVGAALMALPASVTAMPGFYVAYGLLALIPGANPSRASGTSTCTVAGVCTSSSSGDPAQWFLLSADLLGIVALTAAAVLNVVVVGWLAGRHQSAVGGG